MGKFQLLGKRLPVPVQSGPSVMVTPIQLRRFHDDGVQVSYPVRVHTLTAAVTQAEWSVSEVTL